MINNVTNQQNLLSQSNKTILPSSSKDWSAERKAAYIKMDSVVISEEAKAIAAERRALWNSDGLTDTERQALMMEWTGVPFRDSNGNFPGWTDEQATEWQEEQARRERELIATSGTHNLLGGLMATANNGQPFTAIISVNGILILNDYYSHHSQRDSFVQVNPSRGVPGIDQPTIRMLDFMLQIVKNLREIKPPEDNNLYSQQGITENLDGLRALVDSFAAVRSNVNGQGHMAPLENAFRHLLTNFFDESARIANMIPEGSTPSASEVQQWFEQSEQKREEARNQATVFADVFFGNLNQLGIDSAFDVAWASI
jgi:hypothetical protein